MKRTKPSSEALLIRTHRALGLFPASLLYGSSLGKDEVVDRREFKTVDVDEHGGQIERSLVMFTQSRGGLPRGHDPIVLRAVLVLLFERGENSYSVSFRKKEILDLLEWKDTPRARVEIKESLERYQHTWYEGKNVWTDAKRESKRLSTRNLIVSCEIIDERSIRYQRSGSANEESPHQLTRITFNPDFINEIRGVPLSIDFRFERSLDSPMVRRLYEFLNYKASDGVLEYSFDVRSLAHEHLGVSLRIKAPSQCWNKLQPAFRKLKANGYLKDYSYQASGNRVTAVVSSERLPAQMAILKPLPAPSAKRDELIRRLLRLGTKTNVAASDIRECKDEHLHLAETIISYIEQTRLAHEQRPGRQRSYNYGGWSHKELRRLNETGEINPDFTIALPEIVGFDFGGESEAAAAAAAASDEADLNLPARVTLAERYPAAEPGAVGLWEKVKKVVEGRIAKQSFETWFSETAIVAVRVGEDGLHLVAANQVVCDWVGSNYSELLREALESIGWSRGNQLCLDVVWSVVPDTDG